MHPDNILEVSGNEENRFNIPDSFSVVTIEIDFAKGEIGH